MNTETEKSASPKVSVIILSDGNLEELSKTLESVFTQTYSNLECLVADNGLYAEYIGSLGNESGKITYWISEKCDSKNQLIDKIIPYSSGEYIHVINSNNVLSTNVSIENLLNQTDGQDLIYGNLVKVFSKGGKNAEILKFTDDITVDTIMHYMPDLLSASLIKRVFYEKNNFYDKDLIYATDWAFLVKMVLFTRIRTHYRDVDVETIVVGRHGGTDKLSNIQLTGKEKVWFVENRIPDVISKHIAAKYSFESEHKYFASSPLVKYAASMQQKLNIYLDQIKFYFRSLRSSIELLQYKKKYAKACFEIPIIINNKNQLSYLKRLINSLEKRGYKNIYIIDNASTYEPLLKFYEETPYKVFLLGQNVGFCALWDTDVFDHFKDQYYVYTDSDLEIVDECPDDFMVIMHYLLNKYSLGKVGFSLLTDDLPDTFANRSEVQKWEARFQQNKVERLAFQAMVDTTFALYKPNIFGDAGMLLAFRTSFPYSARHLPWYENTKALTDEQKYYYVNAKTSSHWSSKVAIESE
jgi:glycosyltransferase involved in cell wall biosynthesis